MGFDGGVRLRRRESFRTWEGKNELEIGMQIKVVVEWVSGFMSEDKNLSKKVL